eukprot:3941754-Rhodomonas_salina.3
MPATNTLLEGCSKVPWWSLPSLSARQHEGTTAAGDWGKNLHMLKQSCAQISSMLVGLYPGMELCTGPRCHTMYFMSHYYFTLHLALGEQQG